MMPQDLTAWADKIDGRLGPISGRDADALAVLLRKTAETLSRFQIDRRDHDLALRDALSETARTADELAFWRYQAIWGRWYLLDASVHGAPLPEETAAWKEAERQLEEARVEENRGRYSPEAPRDPGAT